jgi:exodeoxyribonuclease-1
MGADGEPTFLWHDYETTGTDPRRDRPIQFAGWRTNLELEPIEDPVVLWCKPARDTLPNPEALLVTGITPQEAEARGLRECDFADRIHEELARPGTCGVGYNSIRFDDEVTRHLLWRNLHDPYGREWRNGNSRWDVLDLARLACALRPEGLEWPEREPGVPSFRLEHLAAANGIRHANAHDALSDVEATIGLARRIREAQPRLFAFHLELRRKGRAAELLDWVNVTPVLHASARYPAARHRGLAVVAPLMVHPEHRNEILVFDLDADPADLLTLDPDDLAGRLYTPAAELPEGAGRRAIKSIHLNRAPALAPLAVLRAEDASRLAIDLEACLAHLDRIRTDIDGIRAKLARVVRREPVPAADADVSLYAGLPEDADLRLLSEARVVLAQSGPAGFDTARFRDPRLRVLAWRYGARNAPDRLSTASDRERWRQHLSDRLIGTSEATTMKLDAYRAEIERLRRRLDTTDPQNALLDALAAWGTELLRPLTMP